MNVLQHTRNELNLCLKQNWPNRSYRDALLISAAALIHVNSVHFLMHCETWRLQINCLQTQSNSIFLQLCKPSTSSPVCITVKNSPKISSVYIRLCKHRKKVFYCFYKITFPRKKKNSLFRLLIKRAILTSREVLYTKLNIRVISSCFAIKMLSKKGFFSLKMSA